MDHVPIIRPLNRNGYTMFLNLREEKKEKKNQLKKERKKRL
jgi:hypothetical protein